MNLSFIRNRKIVSAGSTLVIALLLGGLSIFIFNRREPSLRALKKTVGMDLSEEKQMDLPMPCVSRDRMPDADIRLAPLKLIRNARISLEIQDFKRFEPSLRQLATRYGYLANTQVSRDGNGRCSAQITLMAEASHFDEALAAFKALGQVKSEAISVEDVTQSYADLEARRANKHVAATRLREIIQTRAGKLSDVIEAEQALSQVTEELERMEAQKRGMDGRIAFSTIQAEISEPMPITPKPSAWAPLQSAIADSLQSLMSVGIFLLQAIIVLSPWILIAFGGWMIWRRIRKTALTQPGSTKA